MTEQQVAEVKAKEELGVVPSYKDAGLTPKFARMVAERQELKHDIKQLEEKCDRVNDEITLTMGQHDLKAVMVGPYKASLITTSRKAINQDRLKERLLAGGMSGQDVVALLDEVSTVSESTFLRVDDTEKRKVAGKEKRAKVLSIKKKKGKRAK